jgi:hypothetical protein
MFTAPGFAPLAMFSNKDTQPHARATVTGIAALTQFH